MEVGHVKEANRRRERLFGKDFALTCLIGLDVFIGHQLLTPTLPLYITSLGGQPTDIGLLQGIFASSALITRLLVGRAIDLWGRKWPLIAGASLILLAMLLYGTATRVPLVLLLRVLHGVGFGIATTAASTLAADLVPSQRRGEAMGYFGFSTSIALAIGPGVAFWLIALPGLPLQGFPLLFFVCSGVAVPALLFTLFVRETRRSVVEQSPGMRKRGLRSLFCPNAAPIAITHYFGGFTYGAVLSYVPIYMAGENLQYVTVFFFFAYAVSAATSRPFVGALSDQIDRRLLVMPLMGLCAVGVGILGFSPSLPLALTSAIILGVTVGSLNPVLMALLVDLVKPEERGAAMGTYMSSMDLGVASGATLLGPVAQVAGYRSVFSVTSGVAMLGLVYFFLYQRSWRRRVANQEMVPPGEPRPENHQGAGHTEAGTEEVRKKQEERL